MTFVTTRPCPACGATEPRPYAEKNSHRIVRCGRCGTLHTTDFGTAGYDDYYDAENLAVPSFLDGRGDEIVASFAPARRTGRLLDVGFGAGLFLDAARRAGWDVHGVEVSPPAVEQARQRGFDVVLGTLAEAKYPNGHFDVVVGSEILEHVVEVRPLLREIARVLRPGGIFWATTPHGRGLSARLLRASWSVVAPPEHVQLFSVRGLQQLLRGSGFDEIQVSPEGVNPREILEHLRGKQTSIRQRIDGAYAINAFLEGKPSRRAFKRAVNRVLSVLRLGDSLKVSAKRYASH